MPHLTPEMRSEIRRRVVAPFLDLSEITAEACEDGGYSKRKPPRQPMGRVQETEEAEARIAALERVMAQAEADRAISSKQAIAKNAARIERRRIEIIADFLAGFRASLIQQKFKLTQTQLRAIVRAGTTAAQRKEVKAYVHRLKVVEWERAAARRRGINTRHIQASGFRTISEAAAVMGIPYATARCYHRRSIPPERWREENERNKRISRRKDHRIPVEGFPTIGAAAAHADVSITTARRYFRMGLPVAQWADTAARNVADFQIEGCGQ